MLILLITASAIFLAGNLFRVAMVLRTPAHLRWELYPIPRGSREKQRYGGSYFEETDWWTKPADDAHGGELAFILKEAFLLKSIWENFRALWLWSWLLHWGLYLYAAATVLAVVGIALPPGQATRTSASIAATVCVTACGLGLFGAAGLLTIRATHPRLRPLTTRSVVFNLLLLAAIFGTGVMASWGLATGGRHPLFMLMAGQPALAGMLHFGLVAFFLAYFPFTHMTHMFMKYFTWHRVRWDDAPAAWNAGVSEGMAANLQRRPSWAAAHISPEGKTWAELATSRAEPQR